MLLKQLMWKIRSTTDSEHDRFEAWQMTNRTLGAEHIFTEGRFIAYSRKSNGGNYASLPILLSLFAVQVVWY